MEKELCITYPRIIQLSVKKYNGASEVKISLFRNGTHPITIARICCTNKGLAAIL